MDYKLTIYPTMEISNDNIVLTFETKAEMMAGKNSCADLLLFLQDKSKVMADYTNCFLCEEFVDGEWEEAED